MNIFYGLIMMASWDVADQIGTIIPLENGSEKNNVNVERNDDEKN